MLSSTSRIFALALLTGVGGPSCPAQSAQAPAEIRFHRGDDARWAEARYDLAPGDHLTFVSDGVIKATRSTGELYGFERTQTISTETAEKVVQAAQAFGQDNDITVLTIRTEPALA